MKARAHLQYFCVHGRMLPMLPRNMTADAFRAMIRERMEMKTNFTAEIDTEDGKNASADDRCEGATDVCQDEGEMGPEFLKRMFVGPAMGNEVRSYSLDLSAILQDGRNF